MIFFIISKIIKLNQLKSKESNDLNFNFTIMGGCMFYVLILNYFYSRYLSLLIPLDIFISFYYFYYKKDFKKYSENRETIRKLKKPKNESDDLTYNKISINDTLNYTFKNIGIG